MATYTVTDGHVGIGAWTMTASTVDTVNFTANIDKVRIVSDGAADVYVRLDGTDPTVPAAGASTPALRLPAGATSVLDVPVRGGTDSVRLISSGTPKVSVEQAL